MISSITTGVAVKHPNTGSLTNYLNVGLEIKEAQGGLVCAGSKMTVYVPWSNVAFAILVDDPIVTVVEPPPVTFPPPEEAAPEAPVAKVKKGPFGRPLKPPA